MAAWTQLDGATAFPFTLAATPLIEQLEAPLDAAAAAAATVSSAFDLLLPLLGASSDPLGPLRQEINDLINDLINSGISALVIQPDLFERPSQEIGTDGFLRVIKAAMFDQGDVNRPQFAWGDLSGGVLFMISSSDSDELAQLASSLQILFGQAWTDLISFAASKPVVTPHVYYEVSGVVTGTPVGGDPRTSFEDSTQNRTPTQADFDPYRGQQITMFSGRNVGITKRVDSFNNGDKVFTLKPGFRYPLEVGDDYSLSYVVQSKPPDWATVRMVDIVPSVSSVAEAMATIRDALPITGPSETMTRLLALLSAKATLFAELSANLTNLIDLLGELTNIPTVAMLPVEPQDGGNEGFIQEIFAASNPPTVGSDDTTIGVVLYGGSGVYDTLKKVFPL